MNLPEQCQVTAIGWPRRVWDVWAVVGRCRRASKEPRGSGLLAREHLWCTRSTVWLHPANAKVFKEVFKVETERSNNCSEAFNIETKLRSLFRGKELRLTACLRSITANKKKPWNLRTRVFQEKKRSQLLRVSFFPINLFKPNENKPIIKYSMIKNQ